MAKKIVAKKIVAKYVVVRTYAAGVHAGVLESREKDEVVLTSAKRIWRWDGAWTLNEVASQGIAATSKVSCEVPRVTLLGVIEVLDTSVAAEMCLRGAKWGEK